MMSSRGRSSRPRSISIGLPDLERILAVAQEVTHILAETLAAISALPLLELEGLG